MATKTVQGLLKVRRALRMLERLGEGLSVPGQGYIAKELTLAKEALEQLRRVEAVLKEIKNG